MFKTLITPMAIKALFYLSVITIIYWAIVVYTDVYKFAIVGVIYELLWLPLLASVFIIPVISFIQIISAKPINLKLTQLYTFLISLLTILLAITS
jgi:hypothetical protein